MELKTNVDEIIQKMCEFKRNNDLKGFQNYLDSLKTNEWQDLKVFADLLKSLCEGELIRANKIKAF